MMDLKSSIIEFMRERPFLWNNKLPEYKDVRRRDSEFQRFSEEIRCPVPEIKRVWHVLRTNFFRAHKVLNNRREASTNGGDSGGHHASSDKLWKYYRAMEYVLVNSDQKPRTNIANVISNGSDSITIGNAISDSSGNSSIISTNSNSSNSSGAMSSKSISSNDKGDISVAVNCSNSGSISKKGGSNTANGVTNNEDDAAADKDARLTRSSKIMKDMRGRKIEVNPQIQIKPVIKNGMASSIMTNLTSLPSVGPVITKNNTKASGTISNTSTNTSTSTSTSNGTLSRASCKSSLGHQANGSSNVSMLPDIPIHALHTRSSAPPAVKELSLVPAEEDDEHLYARSLTATLKKFDPTTREMIKLKFQQIIVEYMQQRDLQKELASERGQLHERKQHSSSATIATATTTTTNKSATTAKTNDEPSRAVSDRPPSS